MIGSVIILLCALASDVWIYQDARAHLEAGNPVVFSSDAITLATPEAWVIACLLLWVLFFPLYLVTRDQTG